MKGLKMIDPLTTRVYSMEGLIDVVAEYKEKDNGALGYSVYYYAREMIGNPNTDLIALNGIAPSSRSVRDNSYPVIVNYYAVKRLDDQSESTRKLLDYLLSAEGQACVDESGLVSVIP
jgi:phosphate transport system substrate-binding protein